MKRLLVVLAVLALSTAASAQGVLNGTFDAGLFGWTQTGGDGIHSPGDFGMPASPSGGPYVGAISSWGGNWNGPYGSVVQMVNWTGGGLLSGELYAGAHSGDAWRNCSVEVLWNGTVVASKAQDADPVKWASNFEWSTFSAPITGIGSNELKVQWNVHFAEWTWVGADNLQVVVPEPGSMLALLSGMIGLGGLAVRRRK